MSISSFVSDHTDQQYKDKAKKVPFDWSDRRVMETTNVTHTLMYTVFLTYFSPLLYSLSTITVLVT